MMMRKRRMIIDLRNSYFHLFLPGQYQDPNPRIWTCPYLFEKPVAGDRQEAKVLQTGDIKALTFKVNDFQISWD